jgi:hypothetical protein
VGGEVRAGSPPFWPTSPEMLVDPREVSLDG